MKQTYPPASISVLKNSVEIGEKVANIIIQTVKENPKAVLILPTGSTPIPMYKALVRRFEEDTTIDLSGATIFNLDEYVGLGKDHPLSYSYYMNKVLYEKLDKFDIKRAPKKSNRDIPYVEKGQFPRAAAGRYEKKLASAIAADQEKKADLAILGVGGAYPVKSKNAVPAGRQGKYTGLEGGHIGFNEPGSKAADRTRVVKLTQKTRLDTAFRFLNLRYCRNIYKHDFTYKVPDHAITLGIANILDSKKILLLANMEEKEPVIKEAYYEKPNPKFPATFLKYSENVHWFLDNDSASSLPHIRKPWTIPGQDIKWDKTMMRRATLEILRSHPNKRIKEVNEKDFEGIGLTRSLTTKFKGISKIKEDMSKVLSYFIESPSRPLLPKNSRVAVFSPHPDDDVIDMACTIRKLAERGNEIWIIYMVNGENAVRNDFLQVRNIYKKSLREYKSKFPDAKIGEHEEAELLRRARIEARKNESRSAAKVLGIPENRLAFMDLPYYYHRGFVDIDPIDLEKDVRPVKQFLIQIKPQHIFYSAEADPHGAHGICAEIISKALEGLTTFWSASFWGYRGAYEEWPLYKCEDLVIVPFGRNEMNMKVKAIRAHRSQLNPLFPSFDRREFYERARDRNRETGRILEQLGYLKKSKINYAEVFRKIAHSEFIRMK